jgi:hypothetical protein
MSNTMNINRLLGIRALDATDGPMELSLEALAAVHGGGDPPPPYTTHGQLYETGRQNFEGGAAQYVEGITIAVGGTLVPGLPGWVISGGGVVYSELGVVKMDHGMEQMQQAEANYAAEQAAHAPPPPPPPQDTGPNMTEAYNQSIEPNMSTSDGGMANSGTPVVQVQNQAGGSEYVGYGGDPSP